MAYGDRPFGLNAVRIISRTGSPVTVDLPVSMTLGFTPRMMGGELKGNDSLASVAAFIEAVEWTLQHGGMPLNGLAVILGFTATESGSTPTRVNSMTVDAATAMPYFKLYGKMLGEGIDDLHVLLHKCKVTGNVEGEFAYGAFYEPTFNGIAVKDAALGIVKIVQNETATTLPAT